MVTVAAHFILVAFLPYQLVDITGGANGLDVPTPSILGLSLNSEKSKYVLNVGIALVMTFFAKNILRTRVGRAFIAIRDNDLAASVMGISLSIVLASRCGYKLTLQNLLFYSIFFLNRIVDKSQIFLHLLCASD